MSPPATKPTSTLRSKAARKAFESGPWSRISPGERSKLVWRLGDLLEQHADEFAEIEALDNGKPVTNARRDDVGGSINMFRYMAGWSTRLTGETIPVSSPGNWHAYTLRQPVGVVGQIIPWNFPLMMAAWKLAPALAAGCTIVLKPAEQTPLSALRFGELLAEAGIPDGVVNIVTGYRRDGGRGARQSSRCRQDRLHRLDGSWQAHRAGGGWQPQARLARARRQVAGDRLPGRRSRSRDRRRGGRDLLQPGPMLHGGLAPVRAQVGLRQGRRGHGQQGRQYQGRPRPRSVRPARAASLQGAAHESARLHRVWPQGGRRRWTPAAALSATRAISWSRPC